MGLPIFGVPSTCTGCPTCAARAETGRATTVAMWSAPAMREALAQREIAVVYRVMPRYGWSQRRIAAAVGMSQSEISEILSGRRVRDVAVIERIADGLQIPRGRLGVAFTDDPVIPS